MAREYDVFYDASDTFSEHRSGAYQQNGDQEIVAYPKAYNIHGYGTTDVSRISLTAGTVVVWQDYNTTGSVKVTAHMVVTEDFNGGVSGDNTITMRPIFSDADIIDPTTMSSVVGHTMRDLSWLGTRYETTNLVNPPMTEAAKLIIDLTEAPGETYDYVVFGNGWVNSTVGGPDQDDWDSGNSSAQVRVHLKICKPGDIYSAAGINGDSADDVYTTNLVTFADVADIGSTRKKTSTASVGSRAFDSEYTKFGDELDGGASYNACVGGIISLSGGQRYDISMQFRTDTDDEVAQLHEPRLIAYRYDPDATTTTFRATATTGSGAGQVASGYEENLLEVTGVGAATPIALTDYLTNATEPTSATLLTVGMVALSSDSVAQDKLAGWNVKADLTANGQARGASFRSHVSTDRVMNAILSVDTFDASTTGNTTSIKIGQENATKKCSARQGFLISFLPSVAASTGSVTTADSVFNANAAADGKLSGLVGISVAGDGVFVAGDDSTKVVRWKSGSSASAPKWYYLPREPFTKNARTEAFYTQVMSGAAQITNTSDATDQDMTNANWIRPNAHIGDSTAPSEVTPLFGRAGYFGVNEAKQADSSWVATQFDGQTRAIQTAWLDRSLMNGTTSSTEPYMDLQYVMSNGSGAKVEADTSVFDDNVLQVMTAEDFSLDNPNVVAAFSENLVYVAGADSDNVLRAEITAATWSSLPRDGEVTVTQIVSDSDFSLADPRGLAVDSLGNVYVSGYDSDNVLRWDVDTGAVTQIMTSSDFSLNGPWGVAVDSSRNVYVCGSSSHNVLRWDVGTGAVTEIMTSSDFSLNKPRYLDTDSSGNVYVAGYDSDNVLRWAVSDGAVTEIMNDTDFSLDGPWGVAADSSGNVYVSGNRSDNVLRWAVSDGAVTEVMNSGHSSLNGPKGIAVDAAGTIYVAATTTGSVGIVLKKTSSSATVTPILTDSYAKIGILDASAGALRETPVLPAPLDTQTSVIAELLPGIALKSWYFIGKRTGGHDFIWKTKVDGSPIISAVYRGKKKLLAVEYVAAKVDPTGSPGFGYNDAWMYDSATGTLYVQLAGDDETSSSSPLYKPYNAMGNVSGTSPQNIIAVTPVRVALTHEDISQSKLETTRPGVGNDSVGGVEVVPYEGRLMSLPGITKSLSSSGGKFQSAFSIGKLSIANADGEYDDEFLNYIWEGRDANIWMGNSSISSDIEDFTLIARATMALPSWKSSSIELGLLDKAADLSGQMHNATVTHISGKIGGTQNLKYQGVPIIYGEVFKVKAYLTGADADPVVVGTNLTYTIAANPLFKIVAAYHPNTVASGVSLTQHASGSIDTADNRENAEVIFTAGEIAGISVADGATYTYASADVPDTILVDVIGMADTNGFGVVTKSYRNPGEIAYDILTRTLTGRSRLEVTSVIPNAPIAAGDIDKTSFDMLDKKLRRRNEKIDNPDGSSQGFRHTYAPLEVSLVIQSGETIAAVFNRLLNGVFAYWKTNAGGRIAVDITDPRGGNLITDGSAEDPNVIKTASKTQQFMAPWRLRDYADLAGTPIAPSIDRQELKNATGDQVANAPWENRMPTGYGSYGWRFCRTKTSGGDRQDTGLHVYQDIDLPTAGTYVVTALFSNIISATSVTSSWPDQTDGPGNISVKLGLPDSSELVFTENELIPGTGGASATGDYSGDGSGYAGGTTWKRLTYKFDIGFGEAGVGQLYFSNLSSVGSFTDTGYIAMDMLECVRVACVLTDENTAITGIDYEAENYWGYGAKFQIDHNDNSKIRTRIFTDVEARDAVVDAGTTPPQAEDILNSSGVKVLDEAVLVSDKDANAVASYGVNYYSKMRITLSVSVLGLTRIPTVGEYVYNESLSRIGTGPDEYPLWRIMSVSYAGNNAQEVKLKLEQPVDLINDRMKTSSNYIATSFLA